MPPCLISPLPFTPPPAPMSLPSTPFPRSPFYCPRHSHPTPSGGLIRCPSSTSFTTSLTLTHPPTPTHTPSSSPPSPSPYLLTVTLHCSTCGPDTLTTLKSDADFDHLHRSLTLDSPPHHPLPLLPSPLDPPPMRAPLLQSYLTSLIAHDALHSSPTLTAFLFPPPPTSPLSALTDLVHSLRLHNLSLQTQLTALQRSLAGGGASPSPGGGGGGVGVGVAAAPTPLTPVLKEVARLKRRVRVLEAAGHGVGGGGGGGEDEEEGVGGGWGLGGRGGRGGVGSEDEDSEGSRGRHKDSMSRTDRARSLSQRIATREKRRYRRGGGVGGVGGGVGPVQGGGGEEEEGEEEGEERGRSLSESHVMDRLAMRHFHYRTSTTYRNNPFMQAKPAAAAPALRPVSSIKEEESPQQQLQAGGVSSQLMERGSRGRYSEPIANYYAAFIPSGKASAASSQPATATSSSTFFASFGPTLSRTPFSTAPSSTSSSTSSASAFPPPPKQPSGLSSQLLLHQQSRPLPVPPARAHPPVQDGYDSGGHSDILMGSSPSTSAMALISEGVANAVLDSTPNASPLNSPLLFNHRQLERGQSDGEGSMSETERPHHTAQGGTAERKRNSLLNKIPPPQLKLSHSSINSSHNRPKDGAQHSEQPQRPPQRQQQMDSKPMEEEKKASPRPVGSSPSHSLSDHPRAAASPVPSDAGVSNPRAPSRSHSPSRSAPFPSLPSSDALYFACLDSELHARMTDLILFIQPSIASEQRYSAVFQFVDSLIRRTIGAEVFCHGSFALKTYLPDADLDVSAFFSKSNDDSWIHRLMAALCQEAAGGTAGPPALGALAAGKEKERDRGRDRDRERERDKERERDREKEAATALSTSKGLFQVKSVTYVSAETAVVKAQVGHVSVDISGNQTGALSTLALFEEVDQLVGREHLFKRTILLATTWFKNEMMASGSHAGFLSSYCIRTFVLFIFNRYHADILTPLQGLYKLLTYLAHFDWSQHAFGLFGPIELKGLPKFVPVTSGPTAWPPSHPPLVTSHLLQSYSQLSTIDSSSSSSPPSRQFPPKYINVIDPANICNNLGRSVSYQNVGMIRAAMVEGAAKLSQALVAWTMRPRVEGRAGAGSDPASSATTDRGEEGGTGVGSSSAPSEATALSSTSSPLSATSPRAGGLTDEDAEALQAEEDQKEAYRIVTQLFERTLHTYSGRLAFTLHHRTLKKQRPAALPILGADGQPLSLSDKSANSSAPLPNHSSGFSTSSLSSTPSSPQLTSSALLISDSELETEGELASPIDSVNSPHPPSSRPSHPSIRSQPPSHSSSLLDGHLPLILDNLHHARQFEVPDVSEAELVAMIQRLLVQCGSVPVGKLGSLLHNVMNNHSLPSMLKEKFGGLKRFLERHLDLFTIGVDHPFNPHVHLTADYAQQQQQQQPSGGGVVMGGGGYAAGEMASMTEGGARPGRSGHSGRPSFRQSSQAASQQPVQGGRNQSKQTNSPWSHHGGGGTGGPPMGSRSGPPVSSSNPHYALSPHSPVSDHPHGAALPSASSSSLRHTALAGPAGHPHHRFPPAAAQALSTTSPFSSIALPSTSATTTRLPHARFASTEGLNVTAPAFVSSYDANETLWAASSHSRVRQAPSSGPSGAQREGG